MVRWWRPIRTSLGLSQSFIVGLLCLCLCACLGGNRDGQVLSDVGDTLDDGIMDSHEGLDSSGSEVWVDSWKPDGVANVDASDSAIELADTSCASSPSCIVGSTRCASATLIELCESNESGCTEWVGSVCNPGQGCLGPLTCVATGASASCVEAEPMTCGPPVSPCFVPTCNTITGVCDLSAKLPGESCDDGDPCTPTSVCDDELACIGEIDVSTCPTCLNDSDCKLSDGPCAPLGSCADGVCLYVPASPSCGLPEPDWYGCKSSGATTTTYPEPEADAPPGLYLAGVWGKDGIGGPWSDGCGPGEFHLPSSLTRDSAGNVYIFERAAQRIQKFTGNGTWLAWWPHRFACAGSSSPSAADDHIAWHPSGLILATSSALNLVVGYSTEGDWLFSWPIGDGQSLCDDWNCGLVRDLAVSAGGDVLVTVNDSSCDPSTGGLYRFTLGGEFLGVVAMTGQPFDFGAPLSVSVAQDGHLFCRDFGGVHELSASGSLLKTWIAPEGVPPQWSFDVETPGPPGTLFVASSATHRVWALSSGLAVASPEIEAGPGMPALPGQLVTAEGILWAADEQTVYVTDSNRVHVFRWVSP